MLKATLLDLEQKEQELRVQKRAHLPQQQRGRTAGPTISSTLCTTMVRISGGIWSLFIPLKVEADSSNRTALLLPLSVDRTYVFSYNTVADMIIEDEII